jgi:hypothetical protein
LMMQQAGDNDSKLLRRCSRCGHVVVCSVFRAVGPLLQGWTEESRSFEAEALAMVCGEFVPASALDILRGEKGYL